MCVIRLHSLTSLSPSTLPCALWMPLTDSLPHPIALLPLLCHVYCTTLYFQHSFNISSSPFLSLKVEEPSPLTLILNPGCLWVEDSSHQSLRPVDWAHTSTHLILTAVPGWSCCLSCLTSIVPLCIVLMSSLKRLHAWSKFIYTVWYIIWGLGEGYCGFVCLDFCASSELAYINATQSYDLFPPELCLSPYGAMIVTAQECWAEFREQRSNTALVIKPRNIALGPSFETTQPFESFGFVIETIA